MRDIAPECLLDLNASYLEGAQPIIVEKLWCENQLHFLAAYLLVAKYALIFMS